MFRKITSFLVAVSVLLVMQFAECQAMSANQRTMKCCHTMPCDPANHKNDCCKKMVTSQAAGVLPVVQIPFSAPVVIAAEWLPVAEVERTAQIFWPGIDPPQHSPPDFYIVYASLLI